jgi:uncharacterized protein (DUF4415 family)
MSKKPISKDSRSDWERLDAMQDKDIDLSDIPQVTEEQMVRAKLRVGGKPVPKGQVHVALLLDAEVIAYFKAQAGEENYQSLINEALKARIREQDLETIVRRVVREELGSYRTTRKAAD